MLPDRVSNPGPPTYESGALLIALRGPDDVECTVLLGPELQIRGAIKDNSKVIFFYFSTRTYLVTPH